MQSGEHGFPIMTFETLTTLREKLIKIGANVIRHARYVTFQLAEVATPRSLFEAILKKIRKFKFVIENG